MYWRAPHKNSTGLTQNRGLSLRAVSTMSSEQEARVHPAFMGQQGLKAAEEFCCHRGWRSGLRPVQGAERERSICCCSEPTIGAAGFKVGGSCSRRPRRDYSPTRPPEPMELLLLQPSRFARAQTSGLVTKATSLQLAPLQPASSASGLRRDWGKSIPESCGSFQNAGDVRCCR